MFTFFKILGPEPAFCRLGLGGSLGGYSSHGYTHASHRVDSTQLGGNRLFFKFCPPQSANRGPLRSKTVTNVGPKQAFRCLDFFKLYEDSVLYDYTTLKVHTQMSNGQITMVPNQYPGAKLLSAKVPLN